MNEYQKKAWDYLNPEEQQCLFLTLGTGKSSWEAGEYLKKSHYKMLELRERSEIFFRMFTEFFENHTSIFRPDCPCQEDFKDYIEALICQRKTRKEALYISGCSPNLIYEISNRKIEKNIELLKMTKNPWDLDTLKLILNFDKWNNFRILPNRLQQPSAYKRRMNKKAKIHIKYLLDPNKMPEWLLVKIKERFYYKSRKEYKRYWVALISPKIFKQGYFLLPIRKDDQVVQEMNKYYLYVFGNKEDADSFGFKVVNYKPQTSVVRLGLKYWPEYREIVKKAVNYNAINNLEFNVKTLDIAYEPLKKNRISRKSSLSTH